MKRLILNAFALVLVLPCAQAQSKKTLSLDEIFATNGFAPKTVSGFTSMNDGKHYSSQVSEKERSLILQYEYATGKVSDTIFNSQWIKGDNASKVKGFASYQLSADEKQILLSTGEEPIYRRISKADFLVYGRADKSVTAVSTNGKQQSATFSPDGKKVAYVRDNNLYVKNLATGNETQITKDGKKNEIINGLPDWVYEEEFEITQAYQWSPDANKIAFMRFDESQVKEFSMTMWGKLYPDEYKYKYPKAGEANSMLDVMIYDLNAATTVKVDVGTEKDQYIPRMKWLPNSKSLSVMRMNRHQNKLELLLADDKGKTSNYYTEESKTYIDVNNDMSFLNDGKHYIYVSDKNGFNHIYYASIDGKEQKQLTTGNWDVIKVLGLDEKSKKVYYQSAEVSPMNKQVYAINIDGTGKKLLSSDKGSNEATFTSTHEFFVNYQSTANEPLKVTLCDNNGKVLRVLEGNEALRTKLSEYKLSTKEFFKFKTAEGVELNGWMVKPTDFDPNKKYPVLMFVYGGPGSQTVTDSWDRNLMWYQYLAQQGYMVVSVDGRGTGMRGSEFKKTTYLQMGKYETIDQIESAKYLSSLPYVDANRIGIQGWSFGGYMSSLCITKGADVFKMAIAVAPVTTWRFYDSIYTERYLRTPKENEEGYDQNSPINFADKLKGKFLLIHGTADDNVHVQNSIDFTTSLLKANKQYEMFYYPNKNHSIYGGNTRLNLYTKMTNFIVENL